MEKLDTAFISNIFDDAETDEILLHITGRSDKDMEEPGRFGDKGVYLLVRRPERNTTEGDEDDEEYRDIGDEEEDDEKKGYEEQRKQKSKEEQKLKNYSFSLPITDFADYVQEFAESRGENIMKIEYSQPVIMGDDGGQHLVYQRILLENSDQEGSVYEIIKDKLAQNGIDVEIVDVDFEGERVKYISRIDGKKENMSYDDQKVAYRRSDIAGEENASWEVLVDGDFLDTSIGKAMVGKGSTVEIRRKSGCGGGGMGQDPFIIQNDPTVNKSRLPSYLRGFFNYSGASGYVSWTD